jgi:DNA polymerase III epsilon subunit family exonuclease
MPLLAGHRLRVVDTETTGVLSGRHGLVEVASVRVEDGVIGEGWTTLVNPRRRIPPDAVRVHGITDEMVKDAPDAGAVSAVLRTELGEHPLVFHHAAFDLAFLRALMRETGQPPIHNPVVDTLGLAHALAPGGSHSLGRMAEWLGVPRRERHRALPDALTTAEALLALAERWEQERGVRSLWELAAISQDGLRGRRHVDGVPPVPSDVGTGGAERV